MSNACLGPPFVPALLEYLRAKESLSRFDPEEELILFPELYGICRSWRHRDCLNLHENSQLTRRIEEFIKRTTHPNKRVPIMRHIHEYNFVEIYLPKLRLRDRVPEQIFRCRNLRVLNLNANSIRTLSANVGRLKELEVLTLSANRIGKHGLPYTLTFCLRLHTLHVDDNAMDSLPGFLLRMENLRHLRRLNAKRTVRDILGGFHTPVVTVTVSNQHIQPPMASTFTTYRRNRITKISECHCDKHRLPPKAPASLESLAAGCIIRSKVDYFVIDGFCIQLQDVVSKYYSRYQCAICDNCDRFRTENLGFEINTFRYGHLENNWSLFVHQGCSAKCAFELDEFAYQKERQSKTEMNEKYDKYVASYEMNTIACNENKTAARCCTVS